MKIKIPELALIVLVGPSGSGKSTFARNYFKATEIVSSDNCRGILSDNQNDQTITKEAFELVHYIIGQRLKLGHLTVVDATNVQPESRKPLLALAREYHALPVSIVFKTPERICHERNRTRPDREFGHQVIRNQLSQMKRGMRNLKREGFRYIYTIEYPTDSIEIERQPLWNNLKHEKGPFDIIGDVHGCYDELIELIKNLGYQIEMSPEVTVSYREPVNIYMEPECVTVTHPKGRKLVFVGDLVDRGPKSVEVLRLVMHNVATGNILCVPGNHDVKLLRKLKGKNVQITHGLAETLEQLEKTPKGFQEEVADFIDSLVSHYVLDGGNLAVAHAGMKESMLGRGSGTVREFALYGETTGETDEYGLPVRYNWATEYRGNTHIVYGHTPVPEPEWLNKTINIDTGCVFGGKLTALRYPEMETVSIPAKAIYAESRKPFIEPEETASAQTTQQKLDDILNIEDVLGKRIIATRLRPNITIREENGNAALEIISRFSVNPKWLIYLPPTMSPCATSQRPDFLEHPEEAFAYFRTQGVSEVICEEKHMGSRAVVVICRDETSALKHFGIEDEGIGVVYTRTGRPFINDQQLHHNFLLRIHAAVTKAGFWETFASDWFCLDCELMPWSWKAKDLLINQYAATGAAAKGFAEAAQQMLQKTDKTIQGIDALTAKVLQQDSDIDQYISTYRQYCWDTQSIKDLKLAPFHLIASEGQVHVDKTNEWHMSTLKRLCEQDSGFLLATRCEIIDLTNETSIGHGCQWWLDITQAGGEGMVIKPIEFFTKGNRGLIQPAVKCRGREYLRIIYGPEYAQSENIERLRNRGLNSKRSLAIREFALGIEGLERFVRKEPLWRVHECVFGVLALESEPVDPRL